MRIVDLDDGTVAGVDRHLDPHQWAESVRIRQRLALHVIPAVHKSL
jgi:hypothetical protein